MSFVGVQHNDNLTSFTCTCGKSKSPIIVFTYYIKLDILFCLLKKSISIFSYTFHGIDYEDQTKEQIKSSELGSYTKVAKKHCRKDRLPGSYLTIREAQNACRASINCKGVYDRGCRAGANDIYLCSTAATYETSETSCIYEIRCKDT